MNYNFIFYKNIDKINQKYEITKSIFNPIFIFPNKKEIINEIKKIIDNLMFKDINNFSENNSTLINTNNLTYQNLDVYYTVKFVNQTPFKYLLLIEFYINKYIFCDIIYLDILDKPFIFNKKVREISNLLIYNLNLNFIFINFFSDYILIDDLNCYNYFYTKNKHKLHIKKLLMYKIDKLYNLLNINYFFLLKNTLKSIKNENILKNTEKIFRENSEILYKNCNNLFLFINKNKENILLPEVYSYISLKKLKVLI